ncbi:Two-component response regulator, AmiR/NasT family, consists of REC and RNA-binding antiterminator (ANTAR) domains [Methylobacterium sp. 174MFSha1.1]|uniref:ANTAR domain-containing response regulator n=1 Tax=Methylobacterium sp. 174MFSha1.1 TaxID=1502749 RepID=UPI0008EB64DF|nr:ANTAR domain-containing protein [Methylobacterium sp. 174MFSha1.1]SFU42876.1 Two-component response regulator, AmiR/NasT family, consists of REC and RNA-binding antiterminator (ANTAR) domains [Methylobacterium sp. 174MFSha1.1]
MSRPAVPTVRGCRVRLLVGDERDAVLLHRQLLRMGARLVESGEADVAIVDIDRDPGQVAEAGPAGLDRRCDAPVVALVGTETPSRLRGMLDRDPAAFLVKPLRSTGLYTALVLALHTGQRRRQTDERIAQLEDRIRSRRVVVGAVIGMMNRHAMSEAEAFAFLRRRAMTRRMTIEEISAEMAGQGTGGNAARTARSAP